HTAPVFFVYICNSIISRLRQICTALCPDLIRVPAKYIADIFRRVKTSLELQLDRVILKEQGMKIEEEQQTPCRNKKNEQHRSDQPSPPSPKLLHPSAVFPAVCLFFYFSPLPGTGSFMFFLHCLLFCILNLSYDDPHNSYIHKNSIDTQQNQYKSDNPN